VEVGSQFARAWRAFFKRLEQLHHLDRSNPTHLWLLHFLFLDTINEDCHDFQHHWNAKPIHSRQAQYRSPEVCHTNLYDTDIVLIIDKDIFFLGQLEHGIYLDEYDNVHPELLNRYYGVSQQAAPGNVHQISAGYTNSSDDVDLEAIVHDIAEGQKQHVRHDPVGLPDARNPFSNTDMQQVFEKVLRQVCEAKFIPSGLGVHKEEWEETTYPGFEYLKVGRTKELVIMLPIEVWLPRAMSFAQGLEVLTRTLATVVDSN
jgi:hypothetical protein